jgi:hypothetical protein
MRLFHRHQWELIASYGVEDVWRVSLQRRGLDGPEEIASDSG